MFLDPLAFRDVEVKRVGEVFADAGQLIIASDMLRPEDVVKSSEGEWAHPEEPQMVYTENVHGAKIMMRVTTEVGDGTFPVFQVRNPDGTLFGYFIQTEIY